MKSFRTRQFAEQLEALPETVRHQAEAAYTQFKRDPWHPGLQFKEVALGVWSVRIGLKYRALGARTGDTIVWYWIGSHASYDKLV